MATKRKTKTGWEYIVKRAKVLPKPLYLRFSDEAKGDEYVGRLERLLDAGIVPPEFQSVAQSVSKLGELIRQYQINNVVSDSDRRLLTIIEKRLDKTNLSLIDYAWCENWVAGMKHELNLSPTTIRHHVGALARCVDWAVRRKMSPFLHNPLRDLPKGYATYNKVDAIEAKANGGCVKEDLSRDRRLSAEEESRIRDVFAGAKPDDKERPLELKHRESLLLLFDLALESAMRLKEMYTLTLDQVDLDERTIYLIKTKNGDKRQVPVTSVAHKLIKSYLKKADFGGRLFPWWDGDPFTLRRTSALLSQQFARIFEAAGCPDLKFHDLRHEATSRIYERTNLSDTEIANITGHKDPRMLKRYANLRASTLAKRLW